MHPITPFGVLVCFVVKLGYVVGHNVTKFPMVWTVNVRVTLTNFFIHRDTLLNCWESLKLFYMWVFWSDTLFHSFRLYFKRDCHYIYFFDYNKTYQYEGNHCLLFDNSYEFQAPLQPFWVFFEIAWRYLQMLCQHVSEFYYAFVGMGGPRGNKQMTLHH